MNNFWYCESRFVKLLWKERATISYN